ncbi:hypothetical protein JOC37_001568 [Desulfohalotomaculum tongense]|nr:hypothetical protein [Desulforadius tongensis]MBM7855183.1 hypothetical protein [Desulforadius tongensis]
MKNVKTGTSRGTFEVYFDQFGQMIFMEESKPQQTVVISKEQNSADKHAA